MKIFIYFHMYVSYLHIEAINNNKNFNIYLNKYNFDLFVKQNNLNVLKI